MNGESEWTQSNKQQVQRLTHLINLMISLAKLDERPELQLQEIDPATEVQKPSTTSRPLSLSPIISLNINCSLVSRLKLIPITTMS